MQGGRQAMRKFWLRHVFKERNLHNFWQMIGRRGRGGKGDEEISKEPNMKETRRERRRFCKHLNISEAVASPYQKNV